MKAFTAALLAAAAGYVSYWIRPYDMLADRRRWPWQSAQRCGWSYGITVPDGDTDE